MALYHDAPVTGELLDLDAALAELFDYANEHDGNGYLKPSDTDDLYRVIMYDAEWDDFVDVFGCPIFRESWVQDHALWLLCE